MSKNASRYKKSKDTTVPPKAEKFVESRSRKTLHVEAKSANQAKALECLKQKQQVILGGAAGTGKTFLACTHAANEYLLGNVKQIILIRPAEPLGKTIGYKKGSQFEKLKPLMQTMLDDIALVIGDGELTYMIENEKLILEAAEDVRGRSYKNSIVIVDESQNLDIGQMKAMLTRMEEDSQLILCGDWKQQDLKGVSGLKWMYDNLDNVRRMRPDYLDTEDMNQALTNIGTVIFTNDDCVRSGLTKFWIKVFDNA
jgi:phosphate starvation-inducible PhoH-like protein